MTELVARKRARFEWEDETGLGHPSLVCVEDTDPHGWPNHKTLPILKVKPVQSFREYNQCIRGHRRLPTIKGYRRQWVHTMMETHLTSDNPWYALVVGYVKNEEA